MSSILIRKSNENERVPSPHHEVLGLSSEDQHLLSLVEAQDHQAFQVLYSRYAPRVQAYLRRRLEWPELVDEVLNEVMMTMWQQASRCPVGVPLIAWLFGIARNKAYKAMAYAGDQETISPESLVDPGNPERSLLNDDRQFILQRAISQLPPDERGAISLFIYKGYSYQEIAAQLNICVSTVKTRIRRARNRLMPRVATLHHEL